MKILHTSDWHLGKRLMGRERLAEQAAALEEIAKICDEEQVELVLVAGDVFDTYTPCAEAEELFFSEIKKIVGQDRAVLIISGNHDDGVRLAASAPLAEEQGVYIVGNARRKCKESQGRKVRLIASEKGYAIFENERGEKVFVNTLPYPNEARFKEEKNDLSFSDRMKGWIEEGERGNPEHLPSVFLSHIFVAGGVTSDSEREIDLGGARAVPLDILPQVDYIALGHLHKKQRMGNGNCWYSGSLLQYSFDETSEKGVKIFDLTSCGVENLRDVPLTSGRKLIRLESIGVTEAEKLLEEYPERYAEMTLHLTSPLTSAESSALAAHENLVSLIPSVETEEQIEFQSRRGLSDGELFEAFYKSQNNGATPSDELKELFLSVLKQSEEN